ncbi:MAG: DNA/RNA non-specific endonuclease [Muribaculaceae bacterium]|nr:DNA/RNA non-specific endonuclease [Muribaculaceae bacterium]
MLRWWMAIATILVGLLVWQVVLSRGRTPATMTTAMIDSLTQVRLPGGMENVNVQYTGFVVDFNPTTHLANCTAYVLTQQKLSGKSGRHDKFAHDPHVSGCPTPDAYHLSGMDRGHLVPAGDMTWDERAMAESFLMTNVCPQHKSLNSGGWSKLEEKVREWARRDSVLVILAGPVPGEAIDTIDASGIAVPQRYFKVIMAPKARLGIRAIGFIYDNGPCNRRLKNYAVSVDDVERLTGLDFFASLPDDLEADIESRCNLNAWTQ